ncbi:asparagine synthase (glutamine-hydrolyzing) [bacterium]|nr:asparagine synthase (glutamine-hydrolyzing) [bacterium]
MCGIAGVVGADQRLVEPAVRAMMRTMVHRGPDDEGFELLRLGADAAPGPAAGFGFRRLAILDLTRAGHQPMLNERTGDCLVFNGEIYNFRQLRTQLQAEGVVFRSTSDTEVLLQALSTWGESAVERLQGMFAFAFYHAESRRILLARDPLGIKPLYVAAMPEWFLFASEIRPLIASGLVAKDLDLAGISGMLAYGAAQSPRTLFEHVRSFPAAHFQWIAGPAAEGRSPSRPRRSWSFPRTVLGDDEPQAVASVRDLLRDAVLRHLQADVPVGVFLSAGIDSTIIASFAREATPRLRAFTVGFGHGHGQDEVELAADTARALGLKHVAVRLDADNMPEKWHDWLARMDSPSIDGFNTYVVSRELAAEGVVVGLSGLGADELFGGYPTFDRAPRWSRLLRGLQFMPRSLRAAAVAACGAAVGPPGAVEKLADLVAGDPSVAGVARSLRRALADARIRRLGLAPDRVGLAADYHERGAGRIEPAFDGDPFNTVARLEATHYMADTLLRDTDANSMRHSLEVRVPFLDLPLVNYVSALSGRVKRGRVSKSLLRQAGEGVLDRRITGRPKTGFTLPIGAWMRGAMRGQCEAAITCLASQSFIESAEVSRMWRAFIDEPRSMHWSRPLALVVLGTAIAQWSGVHSPDRH